MSRAARVGKSVALVLGYGMMAHFAFGLYLMELFILALDHPVAYLLFILPYVAVTAIFVLGVGLAQAIRGAGCGAGPSAGVVPMSPATLVGLRAMRARYRLRGQTGA